MSGYWESVPVPPAPVAILGIDLAQSSDYTAISVVEQTGTGDRPNYEVRHLDRFRHRAYTAIGRDVADLVRRMRSERLRLDLTVVFDKTGVGAAAADIMAESGIDAPLIGISIHGGEKVTRDGMTWRVPKRDLVGVLAVALQDHRLKIASALPLASVLTREMGNFRVHHNPLTAHESFSAWREDEHDDLLLSVSMAVWWGEHDQDVIEFASPLVAEELARLGL